VCMDVCVDVDFDWQELKMKRQVVMLVSLPILRLTRSTLLRLRLRLQLRPVESGQGRTLAMVRKDGAREASEARRNEIRMIQEVVLAMSPARHPSLSGHAIGSALSQFAQLLLNSVCNRHSADDR
jgi:hypothetical protein